jgi:hypothetical protein
MGGSFPTLAPAAIRRWLTWAALAFLAAFVALGSVSGLTGDPAGRPAHPATTTTRVAMPVTASSAIRWGLHDHDPQRGP